MVGPNLSGYVCLVTGATKGIGKGIALQLGSAGAKVYLTGRTETLLNQCADEIRSRGGQPFPVPVDHSDDKSVEELFRRIAREQEGRLDVLVNNAYTGVDWILSNMGNKFWTLDPAHQWDVVNGVGLRGHFICTVFGSRMMVERKKGLIVNISSFGGVKYLFNVPYGVGKAAVDRMAADCAYELRKSNVAMVSLWPGAVKTETIQDLVLSKSGKGKEIFEHGESVEFSGKAVVHLAADGNIMSRTGKILLVSDLAHHYGFVDEDGSSHDQRSLSRHLAVLGYSRLAAFIPSWVRIPLFVLHWLGNKF